MDFPIIPKRLDTEELARIKDQLSYRERVNSELYESQQLERKNPVIIFSDDSKPALSENTLVGLKYPLELDGKGGLVLSRNYDRIGEQILEVLETRVGERAYRPFFGLPELLFETIDEYSLAQTIKSQILSAIPPDVDLEVKVSLSEDGGARIVVFYSVENAAQSIVKYSFKA